MNRFRRLPWILLLGLPGACASNHGAGEGEFQHVFAVAPGDWSSTGRNDFFVLEPGYRLVFENQRKSQKLVITVLDETKLVDGVETRVVEERETKSGKLEEVSRNYFAISKSTRDVYYFGEDVDMYAHDEIESHAGSWLSGVQGAKFGLLLPGKPVAGAKWFQEQAPDVALDRSEVRALGKSFECPAGKFANCLEIQETTPLEPGSVETKLYASGIGLVRDGSLPLVQFGMLRETR